MASALSAVLKKITGTAAKDSAESAAQASAQVAAKTAAKNAAKQAAEQAAKAAVKDAGKETVTSVAQKSAKYVAVGAVTAAGAAYLATKTNQLNGSKYNITNIQTVAAGTQISYSPGQTFNPSGDTVTVANTNCTPPIDGSYSILSAPNLTTVVITAPITATGNTGSLTLNTTFESQLDESVSGAAKSVGGVTGSATGGLLSGITGSLGLSGSSLQSGVAWAVALSCCCVCVIIIFYVIFVSLK